jgi:hypothetical protein
MALAQLNKTCKFLPRPGREGPERAWRYSSTLSLSSDVCGCAWSTPCSGLFTRYPLYERLVGPQGRSARVWKISPLLGFYHRTVQPVESSVPTELPRPSTPLNIGPLCDARYAANPSMGALPANRSWQPSCSHSTYQHRAITSHSRQLLLMGTWLPETCWATC